MFWKVRAPPPRFIPTPLLALKRPIAIAIPFLKLHASMKIAVVSVTGLYSLCDRSVDLIHALQNRQLKPAASHMVKATATMIGIAGVFFDHPILRYAATTETLILNCQKLSLALQGREPGGIIEALIQLVKTLAGISLKLCKCPELITLFLLYSVLAEFAKSACQYEKSLNPEGTAHVAMGIILAYQGVQTWKPIQAVQAAKRQLDT